MTKLTFVIPSEVRGNAVIGCSAEESSRGPRVNVTMTLRGGRLDVDRDWMKLSVADTALRHDSFGEVHHRLRRPTQNDSFDAILVIQMRVHRGNGYVVVVVLHARQAACELPFVVVVDIAQCANAMLRGAFANPGIPECASHEITEGLRPVTVALFFDQAVEGVGQVIVHRYSQTSHRNSLLL
jgi:hypothetical protein